jgi:hypothetical protein
MQTDPESVRNELLKDLRKIAEKLPNGLLTRLVLDARQFHAINSGKKKCRQYHRFAAKDSAQRTAIRLAEEKWWKENRKHY